MTGPVTFIIDISHHQPLSLDLAQCRRDGCEACFIKAGEGGNYVDPLFAANLAEARAAGMLTAAYWFIRSNASPAAHVAKIRAVVPLDVPIIPDVEKAVDGSWPTKAHTDAVIAAILAAGYRVPLDYIPLWFWRDYWRSPSLAGGRPLWSSRYPDNVVGLLASEWAQVPASYWNGYGGAQVAVLQFTSSARIAGYAPLDASAFRGTRDQLAALLNQENDMWSEEDFNTPLFTDGYGTDEQRTIRFRDVMLELRERSAQQAELTDLLMKQSPATAEEIAAALQPGLISSVLPIMKDSLAEAVAALPGVDLSNEAVEQLATSLLDHVGKKLAAPGGAA